MKNLKYLFVSKEIAIKLKEKGFDEPCLAVYRGFNLYFDKMISGYVSDYDNAEFSTNTSLDYYSVNKEDRYYWITAPMLVQVIDWFREKHKIIIEISTNWKNHKQIDGWDVFVGDLKLVSDSPTLFNGIHEDYYSALIYGIEESIKLI